MSPITKSISMDEKRQHQTAYEYLCHLEEMKVWIEHHLHIEMPLSTELEEYLRNGIILARLGNFFAPEKLPVRKIYDIDFVQYEKKGLHFKYSDNIINFIACMKQINFPKVFYPETTDIYDMKNMPKLIYCVHALSMYLAKLGIASPIQSLLGKVQFTEEDIIKMAQSLEKYGIQMPAFSKIGGILASELTEDDAAMHAAVLLINEAIDNNDSNLTLERMNHINSQLVNVVDNYHEKYFPCLLALKEKKNKKMGLEKTKDEDIYDRNLTKDEIQKILNVCNIDLVLAEITQVCRNRDSDGLIKLLTSRILAIPGIMYGNRDIYEENFFKHIEGKPADYKISMDEIMKLVAISNQEAEIRSKVIQFIEDLNIKIDEMTIDELIALIEKFQVDIEGFCKENVSTYLQHLKELKKNKKQDENVEALWFDEVKNVIKTCNIKVDKMNHELKAIEEVNIKAMKTPDADLSKQVYTLLEKCKLKGMSNVCDFEYTKKLHNTLSNQNFADWEGWTEHKYDEVNFFYNHKKKEFLWFEKPSGYNSQHGYLNRENVQEHINNVTSSHNLDKFLQANSPSIAFIQSFWRTHKLHLAWIERPKIMLIQAFVRACLLRKKLTKVEESNQDNLDKITKLQEYFKTIIVTASYQRRLEYFNKNLSSIIALQSIIRAKQAHTDYNNLVYTDDPTCKAVSKFVRLLEFDANDLREENEIALLKSKVFQNIRSVNELELEIKEMDVRIGLLVKNRLNLQDVVSHTNRRKKNQVSLIPTFTKEKQVIIDKYGVMFYILQMNPIYNSTLIMSLIGNRNSKFIKETCYALYNYGTNIRDEYAIIKMFAKAMELEVMTKIDKMDEFLKGDPLVLKMVVVFWRSSKAQTWLEEMMRTSVKDILNNKYNINTNPLEIYKQWINQIETETGQASGYPYDIDSDKALSYEEVKNRLRQNIKNVQEVCNKFVDSIISSSSKIPYGIRFITKILYTALVNKFPKAEKIEIFKVIGNVLYYRLINPAIVSPDSFNIVTSAEITPEKRKNLAAISSILQKSAVHNFTEESGASDINLTSYVQSTWERFLGFYEASIDVEDLEIFFNIDDITEQTTLKRPELSLSVGQILEVHKLLTEYIDVLCPTKDGFLYNLLKELGDPKSPDELIERRSRQSTPNTDKNQEETDNEALMNVIIQLPLIAPEVQEDTKEVKRKRLFYTTMKMVVDLMQFEPADKLTTIINKDFTPEQEKGYLELQTKRYNLAKENQAVEKNDSLVVDLKPITLSETRENIKENSKKLEKYGMVSQDDDYKSLVVAISKEIRNRRQYRINRRYDLLRLRGALENLNSKTKYLKEQLEYYNQYVKACIDNLNNKSGKKNTTKKKTIKFTAANLYKQGVILEIEGLVESQFKNVLFEISTTDDPGTFKVSSKLFGVNMESIEIVFQDLLQLQYENVSVMKMFDRAKVNVNLLVFILNKKFYSKK